MKIKDVQETKVVIDKLKSILGEKISCPMCGSTHFMILDGFFVPTLQRDLQSVHLGGSTVPSVSVICNNCGFMSQHAIGVVMQCQDSDVEEQSE